MSLRARNKARTHNALAETTLKMILERGFDDVTITDIAAEAGVSRRTFFRYFPTKEDAFFANQSSRLERFQELLQARPEGKNRFLHIQDICLGMADEFVQDKETVVAQYHTMMNSRQLLAYDTRFDVNWEQAIIDAIVHEGSSEKEKLQARIQAGAIIGVIRAMLRHWFLHRGEVCLHGLGEEAFALLRSQGMGLVDA